MIRPGIDHPRSSPPWGSEVIVTTLGGASPGPLTEWVILMVLAHAHHLRATERLAADHVWPDVPARSDYVALTVPFEQDSLLAALDSGRIDLAAGDVFVQEPLPVGHPFWPHPRSVVTPHSTGFAPSYLQSVGPLFTDNVQRYQDGKPLLNVVNRERGY